MKIQVGKTYKSKNGYEYYIECCLKNACAASPAGTYLGTRNAGGGHDFFREDGRCATDSPFAKDYDLLPNKVKKEGWVARYEGFVGDNVKDTEEQCRKRYPGAAGYHRIEWEEDEE